MRNKSTASILVPDIQRIIGCQPEKTTLNGGGQSCSWSASQGKIKINMKIGSIPLPPTLFVQREFSRLYMDGLRDGLNRLWRDGVTILPRPAKKIATAKNNRPVPPRRKKTPPRPASEKKKPAPSRLGKKKNRPVPPRKKNKTPRPAMNSKIHRPEGGNWQIKVRAVLMVTKSCTKILILPKIFPTRFRFTFYDGKNVA